MALTFHTCRPWKQSNWPNYQISNMRSNASFLKYATLKKSFIERNSSSLARFIRIEEGTRSMFCRAFTEVSNIGEKGSSAPQEADPKARRQEDPSASLMKVTAALGLSVLLLIFYPIMKSMLPTGILSLILPTFLEHAGFNNLIATGFVRTTQQFAIGEWIMFEDDGFKASGKIEAISGWSTSVRDPSNERIRIPNIVLCKKIVKVSKRLNHPIEADTRIKCNDDAKLEQIVADLRGVPSK